MGKRILICSALLCVLAVAFWAPTSEAFPTYSRSDGTGNCKGCHGDFLNNMYISRTDGTNWGNLHNLHRFIMLAEDSPANKCATCHLVIGERPVYTNLSLGNAGYGMDPVSCVGCHGRYEDYQPEEHDDDDHDGPNGEPEFPTHGSGAGLRQHHTRSGITRCMDCHEDADPDHFKPVGEDFLPPYYASVNTTAFFNLPTDPCSPGLEEDFAGIAFGLDNDGDGKYDFADRDCMPASTKFEICHWTDEGVVEISVNGAALEAHLLHGDALGGCIFE